MNTPVHISDAGFESSVLKSELPVLVDFWAPWCGPCRMIAPILEGLASEYDGRVMFAKVNTDENPEWATEYGVQGIPTLLFFRNGKVEDRIVGVTPVPAIRAKVEALLRAPVNA